MSDITEKFILLRKLKYSESDLILHGLSTLGAKKSFIARSALKSKKRFGGGILEPTHFVQLTYKPARGEGGLSVLQEAVLLQDFKGLRTDYDKLDLALFFLNCVEHVAQEGDTGSSFLFNLLGHALKSLETSKKLSFLKMHFCLKFLYQQGVISIDPWMNPFLKSQIADHEKLCVIEEFQEFVEEYLDSIESQVLQYIKTADNSG